MKCPICDTRRATGTHHIKLGDSDNHKNKIMLCRPCHDKVEEIYSNSGAELSPQVIRLIRLEYGFPAEDIDKDIDRSILATSLHKLRRKYRFTKERNVKVPVPDGVAIRCPYCGKQHYPGKNGLVICPALKNRTVHDEETETFSNVLAKSIKQIRASIE